MYKESDVVRGCEKSFMRLLLVVSLTRSLDSTLFTRENQAIKQESNQSINESVNMSSLPLLLLWKGVLFCSACGILFQLCVVQTLLPLFLLILIGTRFLNGQSWGLL